MKTRNFISIVFILLLMENVTAQNWQWAKQSGGSSSDGAALKMICIDSAGNTYHAGTFSSNPCYFNTDSLVPNGMYDMYVAKYDADGNMIWVKGFGGSNTTPMQQEGVHSILYSPNINSITISGSFYGTVIFGNDTLTSFPKGNFLVRIDTSGNFIWVKKPNNLTEVAADDDGIIYAQHRFTTIGDIDGFPVTPGVWFAKYDVNGNFLWARKKFNIYGLYYEATFSAIKIKNNKIFGIGWCANDTFTVDTITVYANFPSDQYIIACFDTSGSALWVKPCAGTSSHVISDIVIDNNKNSYITGPFYASAIFGQDTFFTTSNAFNDFFIAKYDSLGNKIWAHQAHASNYSTGYNLALANENSIYLIGSIRDTAIFCNDTIVTPSGISESFINKYDSSGNCISVTLSPNVNSVACDADGKVYVAGNFSGTESFGSTTLTSIGTSNIFIAKSDANIGIQSKNKIINNRLLIYANPNEGKCNITVPDDFLHEKNLMLQIVDNNGKLLQHSKIEMQQEKIKINLEAEAKGVYNVTLSNGRKSYSGKIIFQ